MKANRFAEEELFHAETAGYKVPTTPKTRDVYNYKTNRIDTRGNFSVESLKQAEKSFLTLGELFRNEYSDAFFIQQDKPMSRIANVESRISLENKIVSRYREPGLSLFSLSLQNGKIYNFPIAQIEKTFDIEIDPKKIISREGGNNGCSLKDGVKFLARTRKLVSKIFEERGHVMTDDYFATILVLSRLHRSSVIVSNLDGWIEYITAGKNLNTIVFGFNRAMFSSGKIPFIPVDEVDEYEALPREWLSSIFNTIQHRQVFPF